jgi:hypothetical protein
MGSPRTPDADSPWQGQPWLTPVLGSGPVGLPLDFLAVADRIPAVLATLASEDQLFLDHQGEGADEVGWVEEFATQLVHQRCGDEQDSGFGREASVVLSDTELSERLSGLAYQLLVVAAQATRTFHRMSLDVCRPLSRWGVEVVRMPERHARWQPVREEYVHLLDAAVRTARSALVAEERAGGPLTKAARAINLLIDQLRAGLASGDLEIVMLHLQRVTEACWFLIVDRVSRDAYPGWTDLLMRLLLEDEESVVRGHNRPRWNVMEDLASSVASIIRPAAVAAWANRPETAEAKENNAFYNALADALWAEHEVREAWFMRNGSRDEPGDLPQVIAFVTSFDMELEAALWRRAAAKGGHFLVVLPVYVVPAGQEDEGEFAWLEATIAVPRIEERNLDSPDEETFDQSILTPASWRVVTSRAGAHSTRCPVVVRLAGCPLIQLPAMESTEAAGLKSDLARFDLEDPERLVHSVTVDEFLAIRQTEADWIWSTSEGTSSESVTRAFPSGFVSTNEKVAERYWTILGVPLRDPAVRLRLLSVLVRPMEGVEALDPPSVQSLHADGSAGGQNHPGAAVALGGGAAPMASRPASGIRPRQSATQPDVTTANGADGGRARVVTNGRNRPLRRQGLAVNTRVDDDETILLTALGFEVVRDRCEFFADDIHAYAAWLRGFATKAQRLEEGGVR